MAGPGGLAGSLSLISLVQSRSSCPVKGQYLIHREKRSSLSLPSFLCKRDSPKVAFHQQITGFYLDFYRHFSSVKLRRDQGTNIPICIQERGSFLPLAKWLGAAVVKDATVFPDPAGVPSLPGTGGNIFQSTFFLLSERQ